MKPREKRAGSQYILASSMKALVSPFVLLTLAGCAPTPGSVGPAADYPAGTNQQEFASWAAKPWAFVVSDLNGHRLRSVTLRFTDEPADTCTPGNWKKVVLLDQQTQPSPGFTPDEAAYHVQGSVLTLNLTANFCDVYIEIQGRITPSGFSGQYSFSDLTGIQSLGVVHGAPVRPLRAD
jgi:hypothetical protein